MPLFAQVEEAIAAKVVEALAAHKTATGGLDSFMFLMALILLFVGSFIAVRWIITTYQASVKEITVDHRDACKVLTETFAEEIASARSHHDSITDKMRDMVNDARDIAFSSVSAKEAVEALRKSREGA